MSTELKAGMLKRIGHSPRTVLDFTEGKCHSTVSARHLERYLLEMCDAGLIEEHEGLFHITPKGLRELEPPNITPPKTYGSLSTTGTYQPQPWRVREGADQHLQYRSRGTGT